MNESVGILDMACPKCGANESRSQRCTGIDCDEGCFFDKEENALLRCGECDGKGRWHWCSKCGYEFTAADFERDRKEREGEDEQ